MSRTAAMAGAPPRGVHAGLLSWAAAVAAIALGVACSGSDSGVAAWHGTVDTMPSGLIVVNNPDTGTWTPETAWRIVETARIGEVDEPGPSQFGSVAVLELDAAGRVYAFDRQAQEIRVFDTTGAYVRTIGRKGAGPGEFQQGIGMTWDALGRLWVVDATNTRISIIDTSGQFVGSHRIQGGFVSVPWPGGFDSGGRFIHYAPDRSTNTFRLLLVRHAADSVLTPLDTLRPPRWTGPPDFFAAVTNEGRGRVQTSIPFSPGLQWRLSPSGDFWFVHTGSYEFYFQTAAGDTLRKITKAFEPVPVTAADRDTAIAQLDWFTRQGGKIDRGRIPDTRPAVSGFLVADDGHLWVQRDQAESATKAGSRFDIFDPEGRYLGTLQLPFRLGTYPPPVVRRGILAGVVRNELDIPIVIRARIEAGQGCMPTADPPYRVCLGGNPRR